MIWRPDEKLTRRLRYFYDSGRLARTGVHVHMSPDLVSTIPNTETLYAVATGMNHSVFSTVGRTSRSVWACGHNMRGQCGMMPCESVVRPMPFSSHTVKELAAGEEVSVHATLLSNL